MELALQNEAVGNVEKAKQTRISSTSMEPAPLKTSTSALQISTFEDFVEENSHSLNYAKFERLIARDWQQYQRTLSILDEPRSHLFYLSLFAGSIQREKQHPIRRSRSLVSLSTIHQQLDNRKYLTKSNSCALLSTLVRQNGNLRKDIHEARESFWSAVDVSDFRVHAPEHTEVTVAMKQKCCRALSDCSATGCGYAPYTAAGIGHSRVR
jgi:hypothetical protein